jgi:hypothetical protein
MFRLTAIALVITGCADEPGAYCSIGDVRECMCSSTESGSQSCAPDRLGFARCVCGADDGGRTVPGDGGWVTDGAVRDGGRDAGPCSVDRPCSWDAGESSDECDLYLQTGCAPGEACRRGRTTPSTIPRTGPPQCEPAGPIAEGDSDCRDPEGNDLCAAGLFCQSWGSCVRYCRAAGPACPDLRGVAQWCMYGGPADIPFCTTDPMP